MWPKSTNSVWPTAVVWALRVSIKWTRIYMTNTWMAPSLQSHKRTSLQSTPDETFITAIRTVLDFTLHSLQVNCREGNKPFMDRKLLNMNVSLLVYGQCFQKTATFQLVQIIWIIEAYFIVFKKTESGTKRRHHSEGHYNESIETSKMQSVLNEKIVFWVFFFK